MDIETIVVGGGVVGLAIATALASEHSDVLLLEREARLGTATSARNSEVAHAGLYYPPGSLKARLCVDGHARLADFCAQTGVPFYRLGKLIVAASPAETAALAKLADNARQNGVAGLTLLTGEEARRLEPELQCEAALYSPLTSVFDSHAFLTALEARFTDLGGTIARATAVTGLDPRAGGGFTVTTGPTGRTAAITCTTLVLAAGLETSRLASALARHLKTPVPETGYAKGHYFDLSDPPPFQRLIYPLPANGGLGIHFTRSTSGSARFGPDAVWRQDASTDFEEDGGERREAFVRAIRSYWPAVTAERLRPGTVGIRPKLSRPGAPPADFAIQGPQTHGLAGLIALYGIESPGLTASLAIGSYVANLIKEGARA